MAIRVHPTAEISSAALIGEGSTVWHWAQVREGARVGARCTLGKDVYIDVDVVVGDDCKIENFATLYRGVRVGHSVFIGPHVCFTNDTYPRAMSPDWRGCPPQGEDGASIGANSTILCGITIGRNAMVAAGAVVTKDVPPHRLVMGIPAHPVGWVCECGRPVNRDMYCAHCRKRLPAEITRPRKRRRASSR